MSDADLQAALDNAGVSPDVATATVEANDQARVDGLRTARAALALVALSGLFSHASSWWHPSESGRLQLESIRSLPHRRRLRERSAATAEQVALFMRT